MSESQNIFNNLKRSAWDDVFQLRAEKTLPSYRALLPHYQALCQHGSDIDSAAELYDLLCYQIWVRHKDVRELYVLNEEVMTPFVKMFDRLGYMVSARPCAPKSIQRVAFLIRSCSLVGRNGIARVLVTLCQGYAEAFSGAVELYVYFAGGAVGADFIALLTALGVRVRIVTQRMLPTFHRAEKIRTLCCQDEIDALVVSNNFSLMTMAFLLRSAPIQVYMDMGFPNWKVRNLDLFYTARKQAERSGTEALFAVNEDGLYTSGEMLDWPVAEEDVDAFRLRFGNADIVYGFYGRLVKITETWLQAASQILLQNEAAKIYIGGVGDNPAIDYFMKTSPLAERVIFDNSFVDGHLIGRVIDVFLDTFPFPGGVSTLEVQYKSVPVVWMSSFDDDWEDFYASQRDPDLGAESVDSYVKKALGLFHADALLAAQSRARKIARARTDGVQYAQEIHRHIVQVNKMLCNL